MVDEARTVERRACQRFKIPGATVNYWIKKLLFGKKEDTEEFCPVLEISRGGIRLLCQNPVKIKAKISMKISIPGERIPLVLHGEVKWSSFNPGKSYRYQVGVQFNPYGDKKDMNYPGNLVKIIALEQKFLVESDSPEDKSEYSV